MFRSASAVGVGQTRKVGANRSKKHVAKSGNERFAKNAWITTTRERAFDGIERTTGVTFAQCFDKFVDGIFGIGDSAGSDNAIECRKCVACGASANAQDIGAAFG